MSSGYVISQTALQTILLHAYKYPSAATNGLLLAPAAAKAGGEVNLQMAVPLGHSNLELAPMTEIAMMLVDQYCVEKGLVIAGYYQANELAAESDLGRTAALVTAKRIGDKIAEYFDRAAIVLLRNDKFVPQELVNAPAANLLQLLTKSGGDWAESKALRGGAPDGRRKLEGYFDGTVPLTDLVDFEAHRDDAATRWLDSPLLADYTL